eukprot:9807199-Lingulodinium_polyedra.AAC.1
MTVSRRARRPASLLASTPSGSCASTFPNPSPVSNSTPGASRKWQFDRLASIMRRREWPSDFRTKKSPTSSLGSGQSVSIPFECSSLTNLRYNRGLRARTGSKWGRGGTTSYSSPAGRNISSLWSFRIRRSDGGSSRPSPGHSCTAAGRLTRSGLKDASPIGPPPPS